MSTDKGKSTQPRMWLTISEKHRRAFETEAAARGVTPGKLLEEMVETYLPNALEYIKNLDRDDDTNTKRRK
jgi:hypothetical protein